MGEMLEQAWEKWATVIANCPNDQLEATVADFEAEIGIDTSSPAKVVVARDTRPSSPVMSRLVIAGITALGGEVVDAGLLTTPQLHYVVRCTNDPSYGAATEAGYNSKIAGAFNKLCAAIGVDAPIKLTVDCANGIGAPQFLKLYAEIDDRYMDLTLANDGSGRLNDQCGADFVKTKQAAPPGMVCPDGQQCAAFDGDADRLMFFFVKGGSFTMLDGDRIAVICASFLLELIEAARLTLNLGIVQTAYANGGSTQYLQTLGIPVACAKTGVKHLHHKALDYDVGVYFEANGHGTVIFSEAALRTIATAERAGEQQVALQNLRLVVDLINQTVGDAISDLLLVEVVLAWKKMAMGDWAQLYQDLPNRLAKVKIEDRAVVQTTNAERTCTSPAGLQGAIDALVAGCELGRSFVRPSGTEDVVRVYAEAKTDAEAIRLSYEACCKVYELANGVGAPPEPPVLQSAAERQHT
jgi:phosphoacetylglucosamine mutase